ncbi:hypothetical protein M2C68_22445, partial [Pseudomonas sp. BAgro211]|nr:hypothetical protein [Pseudomonas sp. BAgro211]
MDSREAQTLGQRILAVQRGQGEGDAAGESPDEAARQRLQAYWALLQAAPRWHFSSLVYPSSWFSGF